MAKQARRASSSKPSTPAQKPRPSALASVGTPTPGRPSTKARGVPSIVEGYAPLRRSTYVEAVAMYEQALRTLQQHNFAKAADLLQLMVSTFPEERELVERSKVYLALCERQLKPLTAEPQNTAERLYAATLALNSGQLDTAVRHLERILQDQSRHDQALYMLAVAYAQQDATADAIRYLQQAIEANPENRALARMDPDLDDLREEDGVMALLSARDESRRPEPKYTRRK